MASSELMIGVVVVGGAVVAYLTGMFCSLVPQIPQLCPSNTAPRTTSQLGPRIPMEGDIPINDITWRTAGPKGPHDRLGYGDDYGYESNVAHISIA